MEYSTVDRMDMIVRLHKVIYDAEEHACIEQVILDLEKFRNGLQSGLI
jgi:hypothetical protein